MVDDGGLERVGQFGLPGGTATGPVCAMQGIADRYSSDIWLKVGHGMICWTFLENQKAPCADHVGPELVSRVKEMNRRVVGVARIRDHIFAGARTRWTQS